MTQKELLYVEDAIMHERNIIAIINNAINVLKEKKLIAFMNDELKKHQKMCKTLQKLLEDMANE